jgi:O-antigen/teichoic acid export membrane protein
VSTSKQSAARRLRVITIDQAIAGASNVLIAVLAARLLDVASFGLFGIIFLTDVMVQGVSRALVCDPVLVHPLEAQERPGDVIGTASLLGIGLAGVVLAAGLVASMWNARFGDALIVLAACLPLLVLQDLGRYLAFATQKPMSAVVLDVTWLVLLFGAVAVLFATDTRTLVGFIAAWGGSGAAAGLLLFTQYRAREVRLNLSWLRHTWGFSWRYVISYMSTQGAALGTSSGVGAIAGARALGGVQGALLLVRPFMTFQVAAIAASIGEITRSLAKPQQLRLHVARITVLTTGIALLNALVMLILPDRLGEVVLGASWHAAQPLLLPAGVQIVLMGLITGSRAGLLGTRAIRKVVVIDSAGAVVLLIAAISGASINGAKGALWAACVGLGLQTVAWWVTFLRHASDAMPPAPAPAAPAPVGSALPAVTVPNQPLG